MPGAEPGRLDAVTLRAVSGLLEERIQAVEVYGAGGCPICHDGEARAFLGRLRRLLITAGETGSLKR